MNRAQFLHRVWGLVLVATGTAWDVSAEADDKPAAEGDQDRAATLVAQLGSEDFVEREAASEQLTQLGLSAFAALEAAATHPDQEVRYRSVRILGQIRELDLQRRLDAFLAGKDAAEYPLPSWSRFAKTYGDDSPARQLFVDLTRADPELLAALERSPRQAADLAAQRVAQLQQSMQFGQRQIALGQIASLVFVAAEPDVELADSPMSMVISYCQQQAMREAINNSAKSGVPKKMLGALIRRTDGNAAYMAMNLAMSYGLDDGMVPALKVLKSEAGRLPHMSLYALMTVAKLGDQSHLPLVEKLLDDKGVITSMQQNNVRHDIQVRDAALAAAILLTKQDLKTFFVNRADLKSADPQQVFYNARMIGFSSDDEREGVHKKWAEYKKSRENAKQPAEDKPAE
jgi:hypothetical protein